MKYCAQCGAANADEASFCEKCGKPWGPAAATAAPPVVAPKKSKKGLVIALVVGVLVLAGALAGGWLLFLKPMDTGAYEAAVSKSSLHALKAFDTWYAAVGSAFDAEDTVSAESLASVRSATSRFIRDIKADRDDIAQLRPPKKYKSAHEDLLASYDNYVDVFEEVSRVFDGIQEGDDPDTIGDDPAAQTAITAMNPAMEDLQGSLEDMGLYEAIRKKLGR